MEEKFDPELHITAGELRQMGAEIENKIPDVAWVPRSDLRFGDPEFVDSGDVDTVNMSIPTFITEPFRWFWCEFTVPKEQRKALDTALEEMAANGEITVKK
jgi:hypothetical protein